MSPRGPHTSPSESAERRRYRRVHLPFQVTVRGIDASGTEIEDDAILHNISEGGIYMRIPHCVAPGAKMALLIRFATETDQSVIGPHVPVRGVVLRTEPRPHGMCDVAVRFTQPLPNLN